MSIRCILVDDEPHALSALASALSTYDDLELVARCENGITAVKAVHDLAPDVLFLDIHMPKLDGFEVIDLLGESTPLVVFVTAYDDYAIRAFENNALDYLLKPIDKNRLEDTLGRLRERLALNHSSSPDERQREQQLVQNHRLQQSPLTRILVRDRGDVHVIPTAEIIALEAADDYVVIHTAEGNHIKQERLSLYESALDPGLFCRVHRSAIINLDYLQRVEQETRDSRRAIMQHQRDFPISRAGYQRLIEIL